MDIRSLREVVKKVFESKLETDKDILQCIEDMGYGNEIKSYSKEQLDLLLRDIKGIINYGFKDVNKVAVFLISESKGARLCACLAEDSKQAEDFYDNFFSLKELCKEFPLKGYIDSNMLDLIKSAKLSVMVALNLYEERNKDK